LKEFVCEDGRLITGTNPASSRAVALRMANQLKQIAPTTHAATTAKTTTTTAESKPVTTENFNVLKERTVEQGTERIARKERI